MSWFCFRILRHKKAYVSSPSQRDKTKVAEVCWLEDAQVFGLIRGNCIRGQHKNPTPPETHHGIRRDKINEFYGRGRPYVEQCLTPRFPDQQIQLLKEHSHIWFFGDHRWIWRRCIVWKNGMCPNEIFH